MVLVVRGKKELCLHSLRAMGNICWFHQGAAEIKFNGFQGSLWLLRRIDWCGGMLRESKSLKSVEGNLEEDEGGLAMMVAAELGKGPAGCMALGGAGGKGWGVGGWIAAIHWGKQKLPSPL